MNVENLKQKLKELFGEQVVFNKDFDRYAETIKNIDENLMIWCQRLKNGEIKPEFGSIFSDYVIFIKKIGSSNRCIIIKIKNGEFKEVHLGDHAYYDKLRKQLGIKQSS
ncbi:hypothetical protein HYY69_02415 [Candidatus Woesearchaeota archaeon]|nr:hypothetical protein [Candidatus Woesearchaeota archaeon]